jgi:DNA-binding SARP family transcriptional activator/tetratricopeptide (TPR) repeat protein/type II secretory pathway predicted ATPase ExeA
MEPQRYLRCLGQPVLFAPTGEPIRFRTRKHLALLVYVAVEARSHRRDRLAELLWPKVSASEARHSLATALSTLRPRLGLDALETSRDNVRLVPGRVALDLDRLQAGDVLGSEVTGPLEVAAFLDGFDITDSAEFTHWKDRQQARLLPVIKDALLVLIDRCRRTGDTRQIEQVADRMLALDELSEEAIRAKMEARAFAGDRLTALEIFEAWKRKLAEELQAVPSELVEGMAVRLRRRGWERTTLANIPNVPTDQWRGRPFIGRAAEYQVLYECWEAARKGMPGHVMVLGDSGVGKTTLVQRLTTAAGLEGAAISRVQCYDLEREIPYSTLNGLVLGLLDRPGATATSPEALAELSRIVPEVRQRFPNTPVPSDSQGETARIRLTEAFLEMLTAIAEEHPIILVLDDLHFADDVSLAVLHLVMRRMREQPIMVVLLARPGELARSSQALRLREGAGSLGVREVELLPLSDEDCRDVLRSLIDEDQRQPTAVEQRALLKAAAGYPMVLELLVQDWQVSRRDSLAFGIDAMTVHLSQEGSAHLAYQRIIDRVTSLINTTTHSVLNLAAMLGPRLNDLKMYSIVDLTTSQTMTAMAELVALRVLRDGAHGLEFVNELVRAAAYVSVPAAMRRLLHGKIADQFIHQHCTGRDELGLEIAWHCIRAGRAAEARPYLLDGASNAIKTGAPFEAERALSTALPQLVEVDRARALVLLADAMQEQGRWAESLEHLEQIDSRFGAEVTTSEAFLLKTRARRYSGLIGIQELTRLPEQLLNLLSTHCESGGRIRAAIEAASILDTVRSSSFAQEIHDSLSDLETETLSIVDTAHLFLAKAMLLYQMRRLEESYNLARQGIQLLDNSNHPSSVLAMLQNGLGSILTRQGLYEQSIPEYLKCYETSCRIGSDKVNAQACANLALSYMRLGEYDRSISWGQRSIESNVLLKLGLSFQAAKGSLLSYAMTGKNHDRADELISSIRKEVEATAPAGISQAWALYSADAYALMGRAREAEEEGRRGTEGLNERMWMDFYSGSYARWIARLSLTKLDRSDVHRRIEFLESRLRWYDALDQAEILNAKCWLHSHDGNLRVAEFDAMLKHLAALPQPVSDQLRRMRMLDFAN